MEEYDVLCIYWENTVFITGKIYPMSIEGYFTSERGVLHLGPGLARLLPQHFKLIPKNLENV